MVYHRTLQTTSAESGDITAVSLMGTDVERIASGLQSFQNTWSSLVEIGIACWLLERQVSLACLAPIVLVLGESTREAACVTSANIAVRLVVSIYCDYFQVIRLAGRQADALDGEGTGTPTSHFSNAWRYQGSQDARIVPGHVSHRSRPPCRRDQGLTILQEVFSCLDFVM